MVIIGAHYFSGWAHVCVNSTQPGCFSHFHGFTPRGERTDDWFPDYPERIPLLGNLTTNEDTIAREVAAADGHGLDFFDMLYYDGGSNCGYNADPGLRWCLNSALAFMLNSSTVWRNTSGRLHFFISYSNDIDVHEPDAFVGPNGDSKWDGLVKTWVAAMRHSRYLKVNGRPLFKVLIPSIFIQECGDNATLAMLRLRELTTAAIAQGLQPPLIGGGWQNPSVPAGTDPAPRPHPEGFMQYTRTRINCTGCDLNTSSVSTVNECEGKCNATRGCLAAVVRRPADAQQVLSCTLKSDAGPGTADAAHDTYVRVNERVPYEWTGTYNAAPPTCPGQPDSRCPRFQHSWWPNATAHGARIFPYRECGDYQRDARGNHSNDAVPYLPNVIAGFDPRPWEEQSPSFAMPSHTEWMAALRQVKEQCETTANRFGFPDASQPHGYQPAFSIYAWNEFGEGGILAPTHGEGFMKLRAIAEVFGR